MSLRVRLSLIITLLFFAGMILGVSFQINTSRQRIAIEMESAAALAYQLIDSPTLNSAAALDNKTNALRQQLYSVEDVRHLDISIRSADGTQRSLLADQPFASAPAWFVYLVGTAPIEISKPLDNSTGELLVIRTNPTDEIAEIWVQSELFMLFLLMVLLPLNLMLFIIIGRWFQPVKHIVAGLDDVERGNFDGRIPEAALPELKVIVEKLNHLTGVLKASKAENDRLTSHSLQVREEERRHLARELHDEMGQSVSAIKAIAFSIAERTRTIDDMSAQGAEKIGSITSHMSGHVRSMMQRLRPAVLDELGLIVALQNMVDAWNENHRETFCSFRIDEQFARLDENQQICVYRIVQEALTNVAAHARAEKVDVQMSWDERYRILIIDNGCGFPLDTVQQGMGLSGIRERSRVLNGECSIISNPAGGTARGTRIEIDFPEQVTAK
jgi:two-component system, NarL family, sensor histidine kinase UhpB